MGSEKTREKWRGLGKSPPFSRSSSPSPFTPATQAKKVKQGNLLSLGYFCGRVKSTDPEIYSVFVKSPDDFQDDSGPVLLKKVKSTAKAKVKTKQEETKSKEPGALKRKER